MQKQWIFSTLLVLILFAAPQPTVLAQVNMNQQKPAVDIRGLNHPNRINDQYIVVLKKNASKAPDVAQSLARRYNGNLEHVYRRVINGFAMRMSVRDMKALARHPEVDYIEADQTMSINAVQSPVTWGLDRIDQRNLPLDNSYTFNFDGTGVDLFVIDTGILSTHNDFGGRVSLDFSAINDGNGATDCNGHGTHVAGSAGSATWGVAKNVQLHAVRVLGCNGSGSNSGVIAGVDFVADNATLPAVANMSLGGGASSALDNAVNNAVAQGVFFAVAAGNENQNACNVSPARAANAYTVGATDSSDNRASFSNFGSCVEIFAPGVNITSTWINSNSDTNIISGTSMASPHVAGAAALLLDEFPSGSPAQIADLLTANGTPGVVINEGSGSPDLLLFSLTSDGGGGGGTTELQSGVAVNNISGANDSQQFFTIDVGSGATQLDVEISGGSGDADLYVRFGSPPTLNTFDCRPFLNGNNETCSFSNPSAGTWHIMLVGFSAYSGISLVATVTGGGGGGGGGSTTVFSENFDAGSAAGWNKSGGGSDLWRLSSDCIAAASGNFKLGFSRAEPDCDYDTGSQVTGWARSPAIDLSGFGSATLLFSHFWQVESFNDEFDIMRVQVSSDNGTNWTTLQQWDARSGNPSGWLLEDFDVSAFISSQFRVRFEFDSVDGVSNDFQGWYVDDVEVIAQ